MFRSFFDCLAPSDSSLKRSKTLLFPSSLVRFMLPSEGPRVNYPVSCRLTKKSTLRN